MAAGARFPMEEHPVQVLSHCSSLNLLWLEAPSLWGPQTENRVGSPEADCCEYSLGISPAPQASLRGLGCRPEAKSVEAIAQRNLASAGGSCFSVWGSCSSAEGVMH